MDNFKIHKRKYLEEGGNRRTLDALQMMIHRILRDPLRSARRPVMAVCALKALKFESAFSFRIQKANG
jgi:hypothetical protein